MTSPRYLEGLNPEQLAAVSHVEGPLLVLAGAGSGKTRVLTTRIAHLVLDHGVDPASILAVTFTNKAAGEMRARLARLLGAEPAGMWIGTFHAIGARLLRRHAARLGWTPAFTIYDADDALREVRRALEELDLSTRRWPPKAVHAVISGAKNRLVDAAAFEATARDAFNRVVARVYHRYERALRDRNAFDFDDLLVHPVRLLAGDAELLTTYRERFRFILVDEYQDTNHAQFRLLELLARPDGNLMVVGDDDQSIYGWRGADIRNILDFEAAFPSAKTIRLERNYRSTARILEAANRAIQPNSRRKGKRLWTDAGPGEPLTRVFAVDEVDEAEWIAAEIEARLAAEEGPGYRDFAVLYRTNAQSRSLEEAMLRRGIPYQIVGGTRFYERREIMDVLAYLRLVSNPRDVAAFDRIANVPRRGIGDVSRARLLAWSSAEGIPILDAAAAAERCPELPRAAVGAFQEFAALLLRYRALAATLPVGELIERLVAELRLAEWYMEEGPEGAERVDNVRELIASAHEFQALDLAGEVEDVAGATPLDLFLQRISLVADVDRHDPAADAVTLMTLHNAKGLEFPVVFLTGLEDGLFPLSRSVDDPDAFEEERRLFYVGLTRAMRKAYLTHAETRRRAGEVLPCKPSCFLDPIPRELVEEQWTPAARRSWVPRGSRTGAGAWEGSAGARGGSESWGRNPSRAWKAPAARAGREAGGDASRRVEPAGWSELDDAAPVTPFSVGDRVRHPRFGAGTILSLSGFGRDLRAEIEFPEVGVKKVMVRYANLTRGA